MVVRFLERLYAKSDMPLAFGTNKADQIMTDICSYQPAKYTKESVREAVLSELSRIGIPYNALSCSYQTKKYTKG